MQTLSFTFPATTPLPRPGHVGVVTSGDLEILLEPHDTIGMAQVEVRTSVDGYEVLWKRVLERSFAEQGFAARYLINDAGATPGMVRLRLAQVNEQVGGDA